MCQSKEFNNLLKQLQLKRRYNCYIPFKNKLCLVFPEDFQYLKKVILPFLTTWNICELPINKVPRVPSIIASMSNKHLVQKENITYQQI